MNNKSADFFEVSVHPSLLSRPRKLLFGLATVGAGIPASEYVASETGKDIVLQTFLIFLTLGAIFFVNAVWAAFNQRLCLCREYVSAYSGLLGTTLRTTRLLYEHVRGVEIEQSLIQRMLGLGDLRVGSDVNKGEGEMVICGIKNPDNLKDLLLDRVRIASHLKEQHEYLASPAFGVLRGL